MTIDCSSQENAGVAARTMGRGLTYVRVGEVEPSPLFIRDKARGVVPTMAQLVWQHPAARSVVSLGQWSRIRRPDLHRETQSIIVLFSLRSESLRIESR